MQFMMMYGVVQIFQRFRKLQWKLSQKKIQEAFTQDENGQEYHVPVVDDWREYTIVILVMNVSNNTYIGSDVDTYIPNMYVGVCVS